MRTVAVTPRVEHSARVVEVETPRPGPEEVGVRVLRVGICGTDEEIDRGRYGEAPPGEDRLVIGHESLGRVEQVGARARGFSKGDLVVALVRRPDDCPPCRAGEPDMCVKGEYTERGIRRRHGFLSERYVEVPEYLVKISAELEAAGVLLEPLTIVEKGFRHAWAMQARFRSWAPRRALILGAGPVGLLGALLARLRGLDTTVFARRPRPAIASRLEAIGARYVPSNDERGRTFRHLADLPRAHGPFDFVLDATGSASVAVGAMRVVGPDGVACLSSLTPGEDDLRICASCLNLELVLSNRLVFGTVNANRMDFEAGVQHLREAHERFPGWLESLVTRRVPMERVREAFEPHPEDVKVVVEVA